MWAPRIVFRCFRCMERIADQVIGKAGPVFVSFAVILISLGIFAFCTRWYSAIRSFNADFTLHS